MSTTTETYPFTLDEAADAWQLGNYTARLGDATIAKALNRLDNAVTGTQVAPMSPLAVQAARHFLGLLDKLAGIDPEDLADVDDETLARTDVVPTLDAERFLAQFREGHTVGRARLAATA
jgi:hypothetical protein